MDTDKHDVKNRLAPNEPNGTFAARDILMPGIFRVYGAARLRNIQMFEEMCNNLWIAVAKLPFHPDKDRDHARSAMDLASRAELWRKTNEIRPDKRAIKIAPVIAVPGPASDEATPIDILSGKEPTRATLAAVAEDEAPLFHRRGRSFREIMDHPPEICGELQDGA